MPTGIVLYILIVLVKTIEVSMMTVRVKLITKGQQLIGSIVGFFEIIIWLYVVSAVLTNIAADPWKVFAYALGFALGNYVGSLLEEYMGLGAARVEIIVPEERGEEVASSLREHGFAVTVLDGEGRSQKRKILLSMAKRKQIELVNSLVKDHSNNAFVTLTDIKTIYGGYGSIRK